MKRTLKSVLAILIMLSVIVGMAACDAYENEPESQAQSSEAEDVFEQTESESESDSESETDTETGAETGAETESETEPEHDWADATCDTPKTCTICGKTEGEALGHSGGEATCERKAICDICGVAYGKKAEHVFDAQATEPDNIYKSATVTTPAVYFYSCIWCGTNGTRIFPYGEAIGDKLMIPKNKLTSGEVDGDYFLYFTDPHFVSKNGVASISDESFAKLEKLKEYFDYVEPSFAMSGGDWFNRGNDRESAIEVLKQIRAKMTEVFGEKSYLVVGNHDYNYQAVAAGTINEDMLTEEELAEAWFPEYGKTYYSFTTESTRYYVFNTGIDWGHADTLTELDHEQIAWFLENLSNNDDEHIVLAPHMVAKPETTYIFIQTYAKISSAYNARGTYEYNGKIYDFSDKTGMVEYIIGGHAHAELSGEIEGIPYVVATTMNVNSTAPTSIFVFANYTERKLYIYGIGNATDREISLLPLENDK